MTTIVSKRFPATTTLEKPTFLNDKNVDGELYALLQSLSKPKEIIKNKEKLYLTIVAKKDIPTQSAMCKILGIKSPKTLRNHLNYLDEKGYIENMENGDLLLPELEDIFFLIPLKTLQYLNDNCKEHVIKIYVYLGQRYKQAIYRGAPYEFTSEELGEHIGIKIKNNSRAYTIINNALELLYNSGLIDYCSYFDGQSQKKKLTKFSLEHIQKTDG